MTATSTTPPPEVSRPEVAIDLSRLARRVISGIWFSFSAFFVLFGGVTFDRRVIVVWTMGTMVLLSWRGSAREAARTFLSWLPFVAVIIGYELSWGLADGLGRKIYVSPQLDLDRQLFGWAFDGQVPTTWLQARLNVAHRPRIMDVVVSIVYVSHYFVPYALAGILWAKHRKLWRPYAIAFGSLGALACIFWALFPTAPPWYAGDPEYMDTPLLPDTPRLALEGWIWMGLRTIALLVGSGQKSVNLVAAVPSLHGAHCLLVVIFLWRFAPHWTRKLLPLYPLAMCFTLVYAGEHYVVDVLLGWAMVAVLVPLAYALDRRLRKRAAVHTAVSTESAERHDGAKGEPKRPAPPVQGALA